MDTCNVLLLLSVLTGIHCMSHCGINFRPFKYYRIKQCKKSTLPIVSWSEVFSLRECISFAQRKRGLAFNYSPREGMAFINGSLSNCQILGCPGIETIDTLVSDPAFDYYSSFGHLNSLSNATCIKNIGIFGVFPTKMDYIHASERCKLIGGDLADVSSEIRTKYLSEFLDTTLDNWYKVAYIGMNDIAREGKFVTTSGLSLSCINYRAWAPGHPISISRNEDCVVLDAQKLWRVVNCTAKLPSLCEFFPGKPISGSFFKKNCEEINNKETKKICKKQLSVLRLLTVSKRNEKCDILNNNAYFV